MRKYLLFCLMGLIFQCGISQSVDATYLNPKFVDSEYKYLRFGDASNFYAGFMWNDNSNYYGDGDDFSIFTYGNRDITLRPGSGNVIFFPSSGGKVGIGTTSPSEKLQVQEGNIKIFGYNTSRYIRFTETNNHQGGFINYDGGSNVLNLGVHHSNDADTANDVKSISIPRSTGNVGIGNINPSSKLTVSNNGSTGASHHSYADVTIEDPGKAMVNLLTSATGTGYYGFSDNNDSYVGGIQYDHSSEKMTFRVNDHATGDMVIDGSGSVGIGTQSPGSYKLAVNGNIRAKEIKVETSWADYVFKEGYNLPTLEEVEKHIQEKGHLINIPSAKEVEEYGVQLGEMNKLLLEKIEELTLYTLEQEKKIEQLKKEVETNKKQEERISKLEKLLIKE